MGKTSQINGKKFEQQLCEWFAKEGYYVIYNEKGVVGSQPCDIIIMKDNIATLVECKNLENSTGRFPLSRIEQNQLLSYRRFRKCGNFNYITAIKWKGNVYLVDFALFQFFRKSIDLKEIEPSFRIE